MLQNYAIFAGAVSQTRAESSSLAAFTGLLKEAKHLTELRNQARVELQGLYEMIRLHFGMPAIPVYLPVRKKIMVRGQAHTLGGMPREIRVYPFHGPATKEYASWQPRDIIIDSAACVFETVIHECAHILEAHRCGVMGHEHYFVSSYCEIESYLIEVGLVQAVDSTLRFSGCPTGSYAATQFGRPMLVRA